MLNLIGRQSWKSSKSEDWHPDQIKKINLRVLCLPCEIHAMRSVAYFTGAVQS